MDDLGSVARELREARDNLKLTREQLAEKVGYTAGYVEKIETGRLPVTEPFLAAALPILLPGVDVAAMFDRLRIDDRKRNAVRDWFRPWVNGYEPEASEIRWYEPLLVPGLLQTEAYAMAILRDEDKVAARLDRQRVLETAEVTAIVEETVLNRRVGNETTMVEQLERLTSGADAAVLVLPASAETYLGTLGSFAMATVDGTEVGYSDTPLRGFVETDPGVVSEVRRRWEGILTDTLPRNLSQAKIKRGDGAMESGDHLTWRKSSRSGDNGGGCVEVATRRGAVLVRDSKNPDGARLTVTSAEWARFVNGLR